jgi:hypothetical protein
VVTAEVEANDVRAVRLLVSAPPGDASSRPIAFVATGDGLAVRTPTVFLQGDSHAGGYDYGHDHPHDHAYDPSRDQGGGGVPPDGLARPDHGRDVLRDRHRH